MRTRTRVSPVRRTVLALAAAGLLAGLGVAASAPVVTAGVTWTVAPSGSGGAHTDGVTWT